MTYILRVTSPGGGSYVWDEDGLTDYVTKYQAAVAVYAALAEIHPSMEIRDVRPIARDLYDEPLDTEIEVSSGYRFKVEEV